MAEGAQRMMP